jgi:hypothetical protein
VWTRSHSDAVVAGRRKRTVVRNRGGLAVTLKIKKKTVGRRNLRNPEIDLATGAEFETEFGTGTGNVLLPRLAW